MNKNTKTPAYLGPERRFGADRRKKSDRRRGVRWEPDKYDRRRRPRRRKMDRDVWDHVNNKD